MIDLLLLWCLAAAPIVWLYLLWGRRQERRVAAFFLWEQTLHRHGPWRRWQRPVSLAIQLAILSLLAVALAYPRLRPAASAPRSLVIVIDVSASMSATDVQPSRLAQVIGEGRQLVATLAPHDRMAILTAGSSPQLIAQFTSNRETLLAALDAIQPTRDSAKRSGANLSGAIHWAQAMLDEEHNGAMWVLTDTAAIGLEQASASAPIHLRIAGANAENTSITQLAVRPLVGNPEQQEVLWTARNATGQPVEVHLERSFDSLGGPPASVIAPGKTVMSILPVSIDRDETLTVRIASKPDSNGDNLKLDDQAEVSLVAHSKQIIFLLGPSPLPLTKALRALPGFDVRKVEELPAEAPETAIVVYYQHVPKNLPSLPCWFIEPRSASPAWEYAGLFSPLSPKRTTFGLDQLRHCELERAVFEQAVKLKPLGQFQVLLESSDGQSLVWHSNDPTRRLAVFQPLFEKSDLPLRASFPILAAETIAWLAGNTPQFQPAFAADILSQQESDLAPRHEMKSSPLPRPFEPGRPLWVSWLLLAICLAFLAEWYSYHRRVTV